MEDPGTGDEHIEPAERGDRRVDEKFGVAGARDVSTDPEASGAELAGPCLRDGPVEVGDDDTGTLSNEGATAREPDSGPGSDWR